MLMVPIDPFATPQSVFNQMAFDQFSKNHDEQLKCDNPPTSNNSDGFSL